MNLDDRTNADPLRPKEVRARRRGGIAAGPGADSPTAEAPRRNEENYRTLFERMSQGVFYQAADGTLLDANPAALRMLGLTLEEFRQRRSEDAAWAVRDEQGRPLPASEHPSIVSLRTGQPVLDAIVGVQNPRLDRLVWMIVNAIPQFRPGEDRPHQSFVTLHDITERFLLEADRMRMMRLVQGVLDGLSANLAVVDRRGIIGHVNEAWRAFGCRNGMSPKIDWIGEDYFRVCAEARGESAEGAREFLEGARRVLHGEVPQFTLEYPCHSPEELRWFVVRVTRLPGDVAPMIVVAHEDITSRRLAEAALRESESSLRSIFDHSLAGILLSIPDGTILSANPAACEMLGRSEQEICRLGRSGVIDGADPRLVVLLRERAGHGAAAGELRFVRPDGSRFTAEVSSAIFSTPLGPRACVVFQDVSERILNQERVREFSRRLLAVREEEKRGLSAALHHEVGSFSIAILARLTAAERDAEAGRAPESLRSIRECRRIIDDAVARLKALAVDLRPPDLDLLGLPAALRQHIGRVTQESDLEVTMRDETRGRPIPAVAETVLFRLAQECLTNVLRHSGARRVRIRLSRPPGWVRLSVVDDGHGVDPYAAAPTAEPALGLLAMKEMTADLGGRFHLRSSPGRGTRVLVKIPREEGST